MKNNILLFIYLLIVTLYISAQPSGDYTKKNDDKDLIRKSSIKSKSVWEYYYVPGNENAFRDSGYKSFNYLYDKDGKVVEFTKYHVYSALTIRENYTYDNIGRIIRTTRYNSNGDIIENIDYKFSSKGNLKKELHSAYYNSVRVGVYFTITAAVTESELFSKIQDELQVEPKLESYMITINITDPEELNQYVVIGDESEPTSLRFSWSQLSIESQRGLLNYQGPNRKEHSYISKFISEISFRYDKNGNLIEKAVYNTAGDLLGRESYRYNTSNRKINYYKYNENDKISSMETYTYDMNGRLTESTGLDPMGKTVSKIIYKYDESGNLSEKLWMNSSGMVNGRYKYIYDNSGRIKEEQKFREENDKESRLVYEYDEQGNMIDIIRFDLSDNREKLLKYVYEFF